MTMSKQAEEVWRLIRAERNGVLCTLSKKMAGWPFGSITPYALTDSADPLIMISDIAEHTRNLKADARASLLVQDSRAPACGSSSARESCTSKLARASAFRLRVCSAMSLIMIRGSALSVRA